MIDRAYDIIVFISGFAATASVAATVAAVWMAGRAKLQSESGRKFADSELRTKGISAPVKESMVGSDDIADPEDLADYESAR